MPVYVIAQITITDRARYGEYEAGFPEVVSVKLWKSVDVIIPCVIAG